MRFSIKWLLVATAYAAVVCASVVYASPAWGQWIGLAASIAFFAGLFGLAVTRGRRQAFFGGYVVFALASQGVLLEDSPLRYLPSITRAAAGIQQVVQPLLFRFDGRDSELAPFISKEFGNGDPVEKVEGISLSNGKNGEIYFLCKITVQENGTATTSMELLNLAGRAGSPAIAMMATYIYWATSNVYCHLMFLFSLLGGLLGLWFWKREERARKPGPVPSP